ncbi:hypothetical protein PVK06_018891 [Gossypium arboreum]|uniref:Uncharacterized protein n=1 Tax=Gossypium arboreum TaxID=29729 RepID=A0ABR0PII8_GOSAR|nr:hypothetical protein PVK06_018891 [Gossypium arboreum]
MMILVKPQCLIQDKASRTDIASPTCGSNHVANDLEKPRKKELVASHGTIDISSKQRLFLLPIIQSIPQPPSDKVEHDPLSQSTHTDCTEDQGHTLSPPKLPYMERYRAHTSKQSPLLWAEEASSKASAKVPVLCKTPDSHKHSAQQHS